MSFSSKITAIWAIMLRAWISLLRRPVVLMFSLVQPLMWMVFFGFLFHRYEIESIPEGNTYIQFLMPGICTMVLLFGASQAGTSIIKDIQTGFLGRMLRTPISVNLLIMGKTSADLIRILAQSAIIALIGFLLGTRYEFNSLDLIVALIHMILFTIAYCSLSYSIAISTRSQEVMGVFIQVVNMPLLFTSSVFVPKSHMPNLLQGVANLNPLTLVVESLRGALMPGTGYFSIYTLSTLFILSLTLFFLATYALNQSRTRLS